MHLIILGLILVVCILVYYIMTTGSSGSQEKKKDPPHSKVSDNLRKEDNVIFLPTADGHGSDKPEDSPDSGNAE
ncbi:MAG: hypothetical protein IKF54_02830 [Eubacterium sp.]|nr:hypothetical protein [Eubacterium sp.]